MASQDTKPAIKTEDADTKRKFGVRRYKRNKSGYQRPVMTKREFKGRTPGLENAIFDSGTSRSVEKLNEVVKEIKLYVVKHYSNAELIIHLLENENEG